MEKFDTTRHDIILLNKLAEDYGEWIVDIEDCINDIDNLRNRIKQHDADI